MMRFRTREPALPPLLLLAVLVALLLLASASASALTPQEQRGQHIYLQGTSPSGGEITAVLGREGIDVSASVMPCVKCHGHDGRGKPEGGVTPSNITWEALTKPYGVTHPSGRTHPPYTERRLKRAITMGLDAAGQRLHVVMPRYQFAHQDLADLVAYLKQLGKSQDPGLTATTIRIGTILPPSGSFADMRHAIKAVLTAYFDQINRQGGIYNRRVELRFAETPEAPDARVRAARAFLEEAQVFALTGSFMADGVAELTTLIQAQQVPLVGVFTLYPQVSFPLNPYVFYLYAGLAEQGRALAAFAAAKYAPHRPRAAIVHPDEHHARAAAEAIAMQCQELGWKAVERISVPHGQFNVTHLVRQLHDTQTEMVFWLGPSTATMAFFQEADQHDWTPMVLLPSALAGRESFRVPERFHRRLLVSFPTLPSDHTPRGMEEYHQLAASQQLPPRHLATQFTTLASAKILVEGLKRTGREVSRQKLIEALEGIYEFYTGLTPAMTYGPNRRIGAQGAYIVTLDLKTKRFVPVSSWIEPD
ncbi:cytochrome c/ABC transporter substrate-binding protein [Candidatus Entotheonella palauensis]|uniref:Cytochrome c domain-containing protein n=1 Tax=Candidatus Entotheonella gemina TaxID=1429439 RepID=W4M1C0_9BACT|nr:ABC transporter substrate-binding protein [Candidatus Entotheonella palauensis]ETX03467.1 MAG: hypothetical protein ETSY2_33395 [Candidatus Entotheonella gemina]